MTSITHRAHAHNRHRTGSHQDRTARFLAKFVETARLSTGTLVATARPQVTVDTALAALFAVRARLPAVFVFTAQGTSTVVGPLESRRQATSTWEKHHRLSTQLS